MSEEVRRQYEQYPYPLRDPEKQAPGATITRTNKLPLISHYLFNGRWERFADFRVLVAGGGTGDATVHLAEQLSALGSAGEIVHLDLSSTAIEVARRRIAKLRLRNVRFVRGSLLEARDLGLGDFDYIDCSGVLHHLEDPQAGTRALRSVLKPDGGLSIMVYGQLGRTGVYHLREAIELLKAPEHSTEQLIPLTRDLLRRLPEANWLGRSKWISVPTNLDNTEIVDFLLHVRDRAYRVPEIFDWMESCGLRVVSFLPPFFYDPMTWLPPGSSLQSRLDTMSYRQRATFSELLAGGPDRHFFFAVPTERGSTVIDASFDDRVVPMLLFPGLRPRLIGGAATLNIGGSVVGLSEIECRLLHHIDNVRSLADILQCLRKDLVHTPTDEQFRSAWRRLFRVLNAASALVLRAP